MLTGYNLNSLKELITYMKLHRIAELEIKQKNERIVVKRGAARKTAVAAEPAALPAAGEPGDRKPAKPETDAVEIVSPISGIFYRAPGPGESDFVKEGSIIEPGQVLCIVEAMKMMNEIKAESEGRIEKVLVNNTEPVSAGQAMFLVVPREKVKK